MQQIFRTHLNYFICIKSSKTCPFLRDSAFALEMLMLYCTIAISDGCYSYHRIASELAKPVSNAASYSGPVGPLPPPPLMQQLLSSLSLFFFPLISYVMSCGSTQDPNTVFTPISTFMLLT